MGVLTAAPAISSCAEGAPKKVSSDVFSKQHLQTADSKLVDQPPATPVQEWHRSAAPEGHEAHQRHKTAMHKTGLQRLFHTYTVSYMVISCCNTVHCIYIRGKSSPKISQPQEVLQSKALYILCCDMVTRRRSSCTYRPEISSQTTHTLASFTAAG